MLDNWRNKSYSKKYTSIVTGVVINILSIVFQKLQISECVYLEKDSTLSFW